MNLTAPPLNGLRIAHLIESDGPGGAERVLASLAAELQAGGAETLVIAPRGGEGWLARELRGTGVRIELFHLERAVSPTFARWLALTLQQHRVALAHSHEFTMAVYGAWAARCAGIPHVFTMHGSRYYAQRLRRRIAMRVAAELSGSAVAVSHALARHLRRDLWLGASRIEMVPNGAQCPRVTGSSLRDELKLHGHDQLVVAIGNLYPVKGHAYLVDALAQLTPRFPRLHVAIAGRGELEGALREQARALNVGDRLHLLGLRSDIGDLLAGADAFVLPSLSEGLPVALLEAMLAARPIVATTVGEIPRALNDGHAGILVPPADATALARALGEVLSDSERARRLATGARQAAEAYTIDRMRERYLAIYTRLLGQAPVNSGLPPDITNPRFELDEISRVESTVGREGA